MKEQYDLWYWYHNISECYYHIQLTVKYRKALLDKDVEKVILESMKGFKERYAIEISHVGFDQDHIHMLCRFLPKYSGGQINKSNQKCYRTTYIQRSIPNEKRIMGWGILDRWILYCYGEWSREQKSDRRIYKKTRARRTSKAVVVV